MYVGRKVGNVSKEPFVKEMKVARDSSCSDMNLLNGAWWELGPAWRGRIGIWGTCTLILELCFRCFSARYPKLACFYRLWWWN